MKKLKIISTIACFFVLMSFGFPVKAAIRIVSPQKDVWVSTDTVQVVGMLEGETDTFVKVKVHRITMFVLWKPSRPCAADRSVIHGLQK